MRSNLLPSLVTLASLVCFVGVASAGVVHDEAVNGDLSNNNLAPTPLTFDVGLNVVKGSVVGNTDQRDFMRITLPPGTALVALRLQKWANQNTMAAGNTGFNAFVLGPTGLVPSLSTASQFLGGAHVLSSHAGTDILPVLGAAPEAGAGFVPPLPAGTYTYQIQQTGPTDPTVYQLEFEVRCTGLAQTITYGTGKPGTNGIPTLTSSPPALGASATLTVGNGLPGASPTLLFLGVAPLSVPFDGGTLLVNPTLTLALPPLDGAGSLAIPFALPATPSLCGVNLYMQSLFVDPGAADFYQTAQTAGLQWTLGS